MTRYARLSTFQADCNQSEAFGNAPPVNAKRRHIAGQPRDRKRSLPVSEKRRLWYQKPNLFKVVSVHSGTDMVQTSVSDGTNLVEFTTGAGFSAEPALNYTAPASLADAASVQMGHPMFCGSLLYKFFGGPEKYSELVDAEKMPVRFGPKVTLDGQKCRTVRFWAQGFLYGKTEVAIGMTDGLVHRIRYGSEPLMQAIHSEIARQMILHNVSQSMQYPQIAEVLQKQLKTTGKGMTLKALEKEWKNLPATSLTTETYVHIVVDKPIDPAVFSAEAPEGKSVQEVGEGSEP